MMRFLRSMRAAFSLVALFTLLLGGLYTATVTGLAQAFFNSKADGSLITRGEIVYGSRLIGQDFTSPQYFWGRISALPQPYNPINSGGSNLSVNNPLLVEQAEARITALRKLDPKNKLPIPLDLVTASASGLDPHIGMNAILYQLHRVALERELTEEEVMNMVEKNRHSPLFGYLGDDYVNIVTLNMALDDISHGEGKKKKGEVIPSIG